MPWFSSKGNDTYICQKCATIYDCVDHPPASRPDITGNTTATNVCPTCVRKHGAGVPIPKPTHMRHVGAARAATAGYRPEPDECNAPMSLIEHCRMESGGLEGVELMRYVNRYYGHG